MSTIPVTILTGFLGAGKTTLLNHLLNYYPQQRIAIIENEFAASGIDGQLLNHPAAVEIIELSNGCVCCNVRGELTTTLINLLARFDQQQLSFDRIILETTGLADPAPLIQTFFVDEQLRDRLTLDGVITLVDAVHASEQLSQHRVAVSQIGFADRLIISKSDLVEPQQLADLLDRLSTINHRAPIIYAIQGQLSAEQWLGIQAFELSDEITLNGAKIRQMMPINPDRSWNDDISSTIFTACEMDIKKIGQFMQQLVDQYGNDMLRYKGIIAIENEARRLIVQGVHRVVGFDYGSPWLSDEERKTTLVIIARPLPIATLREQFLSCQI